MVCRGGARLHAEWSPAQGEHPQQFADRASPPDHCRTPIRPRRNSREAQFIAKELRWSQITAPIFMTLRWDLRTLLQASLDRAREAMYLRLRTLCRRAIGYNSTIRAISACYVVSISTQRRWRGWLSGQSGSNKKGRSQKDRLFKKFESFN
jgi:hypothetical protein